MRTQLDAVVFAVYGLAWLVWAVRFRRWLGSPDAAFLILAAAALALSMGLDIGPSVFPSMVPETLWVETTLAVAEEMLKLAGTFLLLAYAVRVAAPVMRRVPEPVDRG